MARLTKYAIAAGVGILVAANAALPVAAAEWREWCNSSGEAASLGWHFYCDREEPETVEPETPDAEPVIPTPPPQSATDRILEMRRALEEARASAILDPTPEKLEAYLRLQQEMLQRAAVFADGDQLRRWREGLRSNRVALARHRNEGLERFNTALAVVEKLRLIETELAGALSADLRAALAFARGGAGAR